MRSLTFGVVAIGVLGVAVACNETTITEPANGTARTTPLGVSTGLPRLVGQSLIQCPTSQATSASSVITALGGVVSAGGTSIVIPEGALLEPATVTVTVPASTYMEVDISVSGSEHFIFEVPVVVTISYARCNRSDINFSPLTAWYIDSDSRDLLEEMPSVDDKLLRTVTFPTGHLSGYALAN